MSNENIKTKKEPNAAQKMAIFFPYIEDKVYDKKNMLVSAAAGSGKTWVLVERIIHFITDENISKDNDISLKNLLIMTFTVKATQEMKKRIKEALDEKIKNTTDTLLKKKLIKECALIQNANITTIDAFCKNMLEENYVELSSENSLYGNFDPSYSVIDNEEMDILYDDCIDNLLDEYYDSDKYKLLFKTYITKADEGKFKKLCGSILTKLSSVPWSDEYMHNKLLTFDDDCINSVNDYINQIILNLKKLQLRSCDLRKSIYDYYEFACDSRFCIKEKSLEKFLDDHKMDAITLIDVFEEMDLSVDNLQEFIKKIGKLPNIPGPSKDANENDANILKNKKDIFKSTRDQYFSSIKELYESLVFSHKLISDNEIREKYFLQDKLMLEFMIELYLKVVEEKKKKNILCISDFSKLFLDILYDKKTLDNGMIVRDISSRAETISSKFKYIFIDEYQDTNYIQEMILNALSLNFENNNVFMVGDLKQSIYRFRSSEPAIFAKKYESYSTDLSKVSDKKGLLINLDINYRSSKNILEFVNALFSNVMNKNFGYIDYKKDGMLGIPKEKKEENDVNKVKISVIYNESEDSTSDKNTFEAEYVARQIEEMVSENKCKYSDIVVLHRSATSVSNIYVDVFAKHGIPVYSEQKSGFFKSEEIVLMVDILSIIDNPRQNIKLFNVLCSEIYNISNDEMALLKFAYTEMNNVDKYKDFMVYDAIKYIIDHFDDFSNKYSKYNISLDELNKKLVKFYETHKLLSFESRYKSISNLIYDIYDITGIKNIYLSSKNGKLKGLNLDKFYNFAVKYEKSSYVGLYNFLRYITKIDELDDDYGQAKVFDENDDVVNIMTIHASKGLEFKNVFLCGCGRDYVKNDYSDTNISCFTEKYGIALNHIDIEKRFSISTPKRDMAKMMLRNASLEEELRVLYVALTRAVEKLHVIGYANKDKKNNFSIQEMNILKSDREDIENGVIHNYDIEECDNYIDIILKFLHNQEDFCGIEYEGMTIDGDQSDNEQKLDVSDISDINIIETDNVFLDRFKADNLEKMMKDTYNYNYLQLIPPKKSVSAIKHDFHDFNVKEKIYDTIYNDFDDDPTITIDKRNNEIRVDGTEIGNAYHKYMEKFTFEVENNSNVGINNLVKNEKIMSFLNNDLGKRMKKAYTENKLFREQKFMHLLSNNDILKYYGENQLENDIDNVEQIVIQGIIDAFFIEKDDNTNEEHIILIDYKTDKIGFSLSEKQKIELKKYLVDNYKIQLLIYKDIIEKLTNLPVKQMYIYSFALDEEILL